MMGLIMPEICWASKKYNKIISGIYLVFYSSGIYGFILSMNALESLYFRPHKTLHIIRRFL